MKYTDVIVLCYGEFDIRTFKVYLFSIYGYDKISCDNFVQYFILEFTVGQFILLILLNLLF